MRKRFRSAGFSVCALVCAACLLRALPLAGAVKLAAPFLDHAVLQRDRAVPVWGTAEPGEQVTVRFAGQSVRATADAHGAWRASLAPMTASSEGRELVAEGRADTVRRADILVGEVWICAGQSNMAYPLWSGDRRLRDRDGGLVRQISDDPGLRLFSVSCFELSTTPRRDLPENCVWKVCGPSTVDSFSAVGYYFGRTLRQALGVPVGLIGAYWGGCLIEPWIPAEGYRAVPRLAAFQRDPVKREDRGACMREPRVMYNRMLAPVVPYALRGAIWYQGETNQKYDRDLADIDLYALKLEALHRGWKAVFENPALSLHLVQMAPFICPCQDAADRLFRLWTQQAAYARTHPDATVTCIADLGNIRDIHPNVKGPVGLRLALHALRHDYGRDVDADGAEPVSARAGTGGTVRVTFTRGAFFAQALDGTADGAFRGFELGDGTGTYRPVKAASAPAGGPFITLSVPDGMDAKSVRYGYGRGWQAEIFCRPGFPLAPFEIPVAPQTSSAAR